MKVLSLMSLLALAPFAVWSGVCAQDQAPAASNLPGVASAQPGQRYGSTVIAQDHYFVPMGQNSLPVAGNQDHQKQAELQNAFRKAFSDYQNAKDDEARRTAREALGDALDKQYDSFIESQTRQIEELDERLAKLRTQLQKRKEAKSRMVELKLQMVLSQAEGLGFPDNNNNVWGQAGAFSHNPFGAPAAVNMSSGTLFGGAAVAPLSPAELPTPVAPTEPEPAAKSSSGGVR